MPWWRCGFRPIAIGPERRLRRTRSRRSDSTSPVACENATVSKVEGRPRQRPRPEASQAARLSSVDRRDVLLDAAVSLVEAGDIQSVSMETVAEHAGVSRPLVYKHFANRDELLAAVYAREAALVHRELATDVAAARSVEEMYKLLVRGSLRVAADRGHVFAALRSAGGWSREVREEQRRRDGETVKAFSARAAREYGIDRRRANVVTSVLLEAIDGVLVQYRRRPTPDNAVALEDIYMGMVSGAYAALTTVTPAMTRS